MLFDDLPLFSHGDSPVRYVKKKTEGTVSTSSSYENHHETNSLDRPFPLQVADSRSAAAVPRLRCSTSRAFCYSPPWNLRRGGLGMPWGDGATAMHIFFLYDT